VLRDADQLHAEGAAFKFYNAEFKVDVYFAAPEERVAAPQDMADVYLKTQVRNRQEQHADAVVLACIRCPSLCVRQAEMLGCRC
jgi:hypothetical protein